MPREETKLPVPLTINGKEIKATKFAFDDCHKIYLLHSEQDRQEAEEQGYNIEPIGWLEWAIVSACPLVFVSSWDLKETYLSQKDKKAIIAYEDKQTEARLGR